uniref:Uncharacterized protein LOC110210514 n=1 Tax=Phascolarctos cinereus TaxID=38626 RepID=A0A6P5KJH8_PHACI|nr:uncharacterized protein LOC110210514 [Phascolarctos cinereus]
MTKIVIQQRLLLEAPPGRSSQTHRSLGTELEPERARGHRTPPRLSRHSARQRRKEGAMGGGQRSWRPSLATEGTQVHPWSGPRGPSIPRGQHAPWALLGGCERQSPAQLSLGLPLAPGCPSRPLFPGPEPTGAGSRPAQSHCAPPSPAEKAEKERRLAPSPPPAVSPRSSGRMERTAAGCVCPDEQSILPCKKEELQCDNGLCLLNWLRCHYKKDCSRDYMSIKISCSKIHSNQSGPVNKYPVFTESTGDPSLLVSPLLVAGVVIGLVLFLSCVTIIVGSLRKDGRLRNHPHLRRDPTYAPDGFSYGGSVGELRSTCIEEFPPAFDFGAYMETLSQINVLYPDSPPGYEECVGPGSTQIYIPTEDPPPYSLNDPCRDRDVSIQISAAEERDEDEDGASLPVAEGDAGYSIRFPQGQAAISTIALETVPPYETVVHDPNVLLPLQSLKSSPAEYQTLLDRTV